MDMVIDLSSIPTSSPFAFAWWFFVTIGWIYPVFLFMYALILFWQLYLRNKYREGRSYILLAIDVPKNSEQGPKAVENIFNQLAGAQQSVGRYEKWWTGEIPESFSFEVVSINGYIQFIIHLEAKYRDLVEAIIYAQYPDAEIMEVEDYTQDYKIRFPNEKYEMWGSELKLAKKQYYPIRTYPEFEHMVEGYKDSMAGMLEALSRIGEGEQIWVQLVVTPTGGEWIEGAASLIKKLTGGKVEHKKDVFDYIYETPLKIINEVISPAATETKSDKAEPPNLMQYLTPGQKDQIAAIEKKIAKTGFYTRIRVIYLAEKDKFKKPIPKIVIGAFKQFNTLDLNAFKVDAKSKTSGLVWFAKRRVIARKNKIIYRFRNRGHYLEPSNYGQILNSEELASLYHFPTLVVKTPAVKKSEAKKAEPPIALPVNIVRPVGQKEPSAAVKAGPPDNLPI